MEDAWAFLNAATVALSLLLATTLGRRLDARLG